MTKELKPCPLCGGEAVTYSDRLDYEGNLLYGVMCKNTGCCTIPAVYMAKEIAIKKWNTRKPIEDIVKQLEELEKEHPYKVIGKPDTYSQYNEAWSDCTDRAITIVKGGAE